MENSIVSLTCPSCNYQWEMDLSLIDTYKVIKRFDGKYLKLYRVVCPLCGLEMSVKIEADADDIARFEQG